MNDMNQDKRLMPEDLPEQAGEPLPYSVAAASPTDRVTELEAELARLKDHMLRALAETDNVRKRSVKERDDATKYSVTAFAREMIDIADNFQRAIDSVPAEAREADATLKNLLDGIEATERAMLRAFEKNGIKKLLPLGQMFDPNFHEVMFEAPMPGKPGGTIIQTIEPGYVLHDRLLRPARVGVAKSEDGGPEARRVDETA